MSREIRWFGAFRFYPETGELFQGDRQIDLQNQPARVLDLLTRRRGELVTREDIRQAIWGGGTHVDFDRGLNFCIRRIRIALEDSPREPSYLETLPRRGYRFVAPVTVGREAAARPESARKRAGLAAAAFLAGLFGGATLAEELGAGPVHRHLVDWLHDRILVSGQTCPFSG